MPLAIPPELKKITSYIRRAEELDKGAVNNPEARLVAYYLRQYAVQQGIPMASSSAGAKTCLGHILEDLEKEKAAMNNFTKQEAAFLCRKFAQKVFDKADFEDREGTAGKETARTFYASATFLQILEQFGDDEAAAAEDRKRIVYAKWKATDILKALKEGRTPTPGGYGEEEPRLDEDDDDEQEEGATTATPASNSHAPVVATVKEDDDEDAEEEIIMPPPAPQAPPSLAPPPVIPPPAVPPPVAPAAPPSPPPDMPPPPVEEEGMEVGLDGVEPPQPPPPAYPGPQTGRSRPPVNFDLPSTPMPPPPPPAPAPAPVPPPPAPAPARGGGGWFGGGGGRNKNNGGKLTKTQWTDATELTRFALAALEDRNADTAVERLEQALQILKR